MIVVESWRRAALGALLLVGSSLLLGWGASHVHAVPGWELAMAAALLAGLAVTRRLGFDHPCAWFTVLLSAYFLLGAQNWIEVDGGAGTFRSHLDTNGVLRIPVIALVAFGCGALITSRGTRRDWAIAGRVQPDLAMRSTGRILFGVGLLGVLYTTQRFGVLLLHSYSRGHIPGAAELGALCLVPGSLLLACTASTTKAKLVWVVAGAGALSLLAYRTPVLLLIGSFAVYEVSRGAIRGRTLLLVGIGLAVFSLGLYNLRLTQSSQVIYGNRVIGVGPLKAVPALTPLYYGFAREGTAVSSQLEHLIPNQTPYYDGAAQFQSVETLLPVGGGQTATGRRRLDTRELVTELAYGTSSARTSLTPTIIGGPYMDFGVLGVIIELTAFGALCGWLYARSRQGPVQTKLLSAFTRVCWTACWRSPCRP
jgi:hypothetical protein